MNNNIMQITSQKNLISVIYIYCMHAVSLNHQNTSFPKEDPAAQVRPSKKVNHLYLIENKQTLLLATYWRDNGKKFD